MIPFIIDEVQRQKQKNISRWYTVSSSAAASVVGAVALATVTMVKKSEQEGEGNEGGRLG